MQVGVQNQAKWKIQSQLGCLWLQSNSRGGFYQEYSPVIHDILARVLIIIMIIYGLQGKLVDIETAFLYGDLAEEVYMDCPEGMVDIGEDEALLLQSTTYLRPRTKCKAVLQESDQYSQRSGI